MKLSKKICSNPTFGERTVSGRNAIKVDIVQLLQSNFALRFNVMASEEHVRQYLAYWFQLGKHLLMRGGDVSLLPRPVIQGDRYSREFEHCWQQVCSAKAGDCYLEGTDQTIAELLSPTWEIDPCSRCAMPVPVKVQGIAALECPCTDLPGWPNAELPQPRAPISNQVSMGQMRDRLRKANG